MKGCLVQPLFIRIPSFQFFQGFKQSILQCFLCNCWIWILFLVIKIHIFLDYARDHLSKLFLTCVICCKMHNVRCNHELRWKDSTTCRGVLSFQSAFVFFKAINSYCCVSIQSSNSMTSMVAMRFVVLRPYKQHDHLDIKPLDYIH